MEVCLSKKSWTECVWTSTWSVWGGCSMILHAMLRAVTWQWRWADQTAGMSRQRTCRRFLISDVQLGALSKHHMKADQETFVHCLIKTWRKKASNCSGIGVKVQCGRVFFYTALCVHSVKCCDVRDDLSCGRRTTARLLRMHTL